MPGVRPAAAPAPDAAAARDAGAPVRAPAVIELRDVRKTYRMGEVDVQPLRGVSVSVARGELVAIQGASGSGKTTLLNIIGCLDRPTSGSYVLEGRDVSRLSKDELAAVRHRTFGFVFQQFNLLGRTSALENVELPLLYGDTPPSRERHERARTLLERVGLGDRIDHHPGQLSGGQQQRVAIARSLVTRPSVLLADEPTGNLDSKAGAEILELFLQLNREGLTIVLVTHDPSVAARAPRQIVVRDGLIVEGGA
jgi:putative ABC transport system ATP-binding protein